MGGYGSNFLYFPMQDVLWQKAKNYLTQKEILTAKF